MKKIIDQEVYKKLQSLESYELLTDPAYIINLRKDVIRDLRLLKPFENIKSEYTRNLEKSFKKIKVLELVQNRIYKKPEAFCKYYFQELSSYLYEKTIYDSLNDKKDTIIDLNLICELKDVLTFDNFLKLIETLNEDLLNLILEYFIRLDNVIPDFNKGRA